MNIHTAHPWPRRKFLKGLAAAGGSGLLGVGTGTALAEPPPETTTITIVFDPNVPVLCYGPQYVATELLRLEGFTEVRYVPYDQDGGMDAAVVANGEAHISAGWVGDFVTVADRRSSIVALSGMHIGCTEIFAGERVQSFRDIKGKKVALYGEGSAEQTWFSMMFAYIGLDPDQDIDWVVHPYHEWGRLLTEGQVDAIMLWPPDAQVFREKKIGHVILNTTTDRPWRDYFCCIIAGNRDFVRSNPAATKRALRAILKATDLCALDPERAAQMVIDNGFPTNYDRALQVFREIPYAQWREYDPEDTLRFYTLRLHELGMVKQTPQLLISESTDWRFLNELARELKA